MKKFLVVIFFLPSVMLFADYVCPGEKYDPCSYDADLFRKCEKVFFANGELLYWREELSTSEYAFEYDRAPLNISYGLGSYKYAHYDYSPGFRIAFGYYNAPHYWQIYGQFTWIRISGSDNIKNVGTPSNFIAGTFPHNFLNPLQEADSKIKLYHELGDLLVLRVFLPNPHMRLRLFGGLTGGRIKQNWKIVYLDTTLQTATVINKLNFYGMGLRMGIDFDWFLRSNFYITGKVSLASLVGRHRNFASIFSTDINDFREHVKGSRNRGVFNVQFFLGPSYQKSLCRSRFEVFAGYELNSWINVLEINRTSGGSGQTNTHEKEPRINSGLLLLHGLTARITYDF